MIHALSKLYEVPFLRDAAKSVIGALIGGGSTAVLAAPASSLLKTIPIIGTLAGGLTQPAIAAAATYALGKVFVQHFETGGTPLNFNPEDVRRYYNEQFAMARDKRSTIIASPK